MCALFQPHPLALDFRVETMIRQSADGVYLLESVVRGQHVYRCICTPHVGHEENNEIDLRAVAVVKDSIIVGFKYHRRLISVIWHEKYSCSASYDNFPSNVHSKEMHPLWHGMSYNDVIFSVLKYITFLFLRVSKIIAFRLTRLSQLKPVLQ